MRMLLFLIHFCQITFPGYHEPSTSGAPYFHTTHHTSDVSAISRFSGTTKLAKDSWLASRAWYQESTSKTSYYARYISSTGSAGTTLWLAVSGTGKNYTISYALAPVVSLQKGIKIDITGSADGSINNPWVLIE